MGKAYDYKNIIETIDGAASQFESCTTASEKILFDAAMNAARELDYDPKTGKIKTTTANIARLARIKAKLTNAAASNTYLQGVRKLAETFGAIHDEQLQYFRSNFAAKTLDEKSVRDKYAALKKATIENTIEGLTGQGLQANVTDAISRMLMTAVTSGEKYADLTEQLHQELISSQGKTGSLARYANTYATTAMTQYAGQQNRMFTDDLDIKWFRYVGSTIETTRRFCELLTQKEYIHISEIPEILKGRIEIGGEIKTCPINPKTELPYGLIEGTTPENFAVNVGGWNCRHQLVPVADEAVPKNIREKFEETDKEINLTKIKETADKIVKLIKGENSTPANKNQEKVKLLSDYKTAEDVRTTITEMWKIDKNIFVNIADESKIELTITNKPKTNGSTNKRGKISLSQERLDRVINLFKKITKGDIDSITKDEADAAATLWHEITHNRHNIRNDRSQKRSFQETEYMELANEYVARHTLDKFYRTLGINDMPHKEFATSRKSTNYNDWVIKYQKLTDIFALNETIVLKNVQNGLFNSDYAMQKKVLADALLQAGLDKYSYLGNAKKETQVGISEAEILIQLCTDKSINEWTIKDEIGRIFPNLNKKGFIR